MRLEVTRKSDLAIRALIALEESGTVTKRSDLADRLDAAPSFMAQVMTPLVHAGWVQSSPGPGGGYSTSIELDAVSILDVIELVEGPTDTGRCAVGGLCEADGLCALHHAWTEARATLSAHLARTSVAAAAAAGHDPSIPLTRPGSEAQ